MEKKTKKLQLRKETIAVLNGERMVHVIGGMGNGCQMNGQFYLNGEMINNNGDACVCMNGDWQCGPMAGSIVNCTDLQYTCSCNNYGTNITKGQSCTCPPEVVPPTSGALSCINPKC